MMFVRKILTDILNDLEAFPQYLKVVNQTLQSRKKSEVKPSEK